MPLPAKFRCKNDYPLLLPMFAYLFLLLFSFQFAFFLWIKLGLFLLFLFAFIFFPVITHICFSVL